MKIAYLFPGQGSQKVGMGKEIYENYEEARKIYEMASEILGINVQKLCFESTEETLSQTQNTQIALVVTSLAILEVLKKHDINADICTGLSLGEYVALIYGGYISFEDGLKLIQKRGYYMQNKVPNGEYAMAAVIGIESNIIEDVCKQITGFVVPANYNYSGQTVISGEKESVKKACEMLKEKGAKRVIELNTSGPFHTEKLNGTKELYEKELEKVNFKMGEIPVIKNLDGTLYSKQDDMVDTLSKHIISPVRFDKEIKLMEKENIDLYIEIGPGKTLTGFIKKELKDVETMSVSNVEDLNKLIERLG